MDRHQPSHFPNHLGPSSSNIRRRSGTYPKPTIPSNCSSEDLNIHANFPHRSDATPQSSLTFIEPSLMFGGPSNSNQRDISLKTLPEESIFSCIPLSPAPDRHPSTSSNRSAKTSSSRLSRLPTPDYSVDHRSHAYGPQSSYDQGATLSRGSTIRSLMARGWEFVRLPVHQPQMSYYPPRTSSRSSGSFSSGRSQSSQGGPHSMRLAPSRLSTTSASTSKSSTSSIDSGRQSLISSVGTTEKFTHKWPLPKGMLHPSSLNSEDDLDPRATHILAAMEDERGLGIETVGKWTVFKWSLLLSVVTVLIYGTAVLVAVILTWFRAWLLADVMYVADYDLLVLATLAAALLLFTAMVGLTGTILNSRSILAIYTLLLWPTFISILVVGYISYKRSTFSLDRKLGHAWSAYYTPLGRLMIQDTLKCCGFLNALHEATPSGRCYARAPLPGCKGPLLRFEKANLDSLWAAAFSLVPIHVINIVVALLCTNHITHRFGKGITPKQYRLTEKDVQRDATEIKRRIGKGDAATMRATLIRDDWYDRTPLDW
ncbi:hypothetical protein HGRIS_005636 [Hohenbuehelia grisea]|uniref:Tetraspanin Tsp2 n=1 Tax=Hohenbuehelia grisea TaxID=104357 RepID=A0ABR3JXG2_9AGAR